MSLTCLWVVFIFEEVFWVSLMPKIIKQIYTTQLSIVMLPYKTARFVKCKNEKINYAQKLRWMQTPTTASFKVFLFAEQSSDVGRESTFKWTETCSLTNFWCALRFFFIMAAGCDLFPLWTSKIVWKLPHTQDAVQLQVRKQSDLELGNITCREE